MSEQPQYYGPGFQPPQTSAMAVASLISSILGITLVPTIGSVIGIILGYMARNQIRESGGVIGGEGLATGGIVLGWIGVGLALIGICLVVLFWAGVLSLPLGIGLCGGLGNVY